MRRGCADYARVGQLVQAVQRKQYIEILRRVLGHNVQMVNGRVRGGGAAGNDAKARVAPPWIGALPLLIKRSVAP